MSSVLWPNITRFITGMRGSSSRRARSSAPVSYTHLDVYKRQLLECGHDGVVDLHGAGELLTAVDDAVADGVDLLHGGDHTVLGAGQLVDDRSNGLGVDVYKRQPEDISCMIAPLSASRSSVPRGTRMRRLSPPRPEQRLF